MGVRLYTRAWRDAVEMSPRSSASRTASSLRASSRDKYGAQPFSASISSTSTCRVTTLADHLGGLLLDGDLQRRGRAAQPGVRQVPGPRGGGLLRRALEAAGLGGVPVGTDEAGTSSQGRTAADNATVRSVFVIGPDKKVKAMLTYPMSTGRNFDEVLRLLDSCQLTAKHKVATPVNWKQGQDVIIVPAVSDEDAKKTYPGGWKAPKPYMRIVPQPK
jgi:C-terminal domain of 1-Cys peroxiredoxin